MTEPDRTIDDLETTVRQKLVELMRRAKEAQITARDILHRAKPFREIHKALQHLRRENDAHLADMADQAGNAGQQRALTIKTLEHNAGEDVAACSYIVESQRDMWDVYLATSGQQYEQWFAAVRAWRETMWARYDRMLQWLKATERRWIDEVSTDAESSGKSGDEDSSLPNDG